MTSVYPQLFPKHFDSDMNPTEVYSFEKTTSSFYIPDCQRESFEEFIKINNLAKLFFTDLFSHCLKADGTINFEQVESWCQLKDVPTVAENGRMKKKCFRNLHVIHADNFTKLKEAGGKCPWCLKAIKVLVTCPTWEAKLRYPDCDINWEVEQAKLTGSNTVTLVRERSNSCGKELSLIHLIFLIDFAAQNLSPQENPPSDGIIDKFTSYDREYAMKVLSALRNELFSGEIETWMNYLSSKSDLLSLRSDLSEFLKNCPTSLYEPMAFTDYVLRNYPQIGKLKEVKENCEFYSRPIKPLHCPVTPAHRPPPTLVKEGSCMPIRYLLLSTIFICSFLYFFSTLLIAFFKSRFFFGEEI